jgi:hypothetical protein
MKRMHRIAVILLAILALGCSVNSAFAQSPSNGQTIEQALRAGAESGGSAYAGDCSHARPPQDYGKTCTKLYEERGSLRAYMVGQTFSEFRRWIFVENDPGGWVVIATAPMDFRASPIVVPWPPLVLPGN